MSDDKYICSVCGMALRHAGNIAGWFHIVHDSRLCKGGIAQYVDDRSELDRLRDAVWNSGECYVGDQYDSAECFFCGCRAHRAHADNCPWLDENNRRGDL